MKLKNFLFLAALFMIALPMFGQEAVANAGNRIIDWKPVLAGIGMAIASGLCGLAQGKAVAGSAEAMARNPGAIPAIRFALILGLVLIESLALYTLVIILIAK
ncbi:MAG TPA: ATP synthase F0 subunit C [Bryobacteraceae bacterium]|jgi:F-type H+-transporting ATPase subunit c|nr:ATP synthase F0 subunit C [Bryobacteraceae bacterium]